MVMSISLSPCGKVTFETVTVGDGIMVKSSPKLAVPALMTISVGYSAQDSLVTYEPILNAFYFPQKIVIFKILPLFSTRFIQKS